jgi:hypothetical protein
MQSYSWAEGYSRHRASWLPPRARQQLTGNNPKCTGNNSYVQTSHTKPPHNQQHVKKDETCGLWLVQTSQTKTPHNHQHVKKGETCLLSSKRAMCKHLTPNYHATNNMWKKMRPAIQHQVSHQTTTQPPTCEKRWDLRRVQHALRPATKIGNRGTIY